MGLYNNINVLVVWFCNIVHISYSQDMLCMIFNIDVEKSCFGVKYMIFVFSTSRKYKIESEMYSSRNTTAFDIALEISS